MKSWLAGFRTSVALDAGELRHSPGDSEEINCCEEDIRSIDRRLKATQPATPVPTRLHTSVMRAVRSSAAESNVRQASRWSWRWLPAPALAMLVICGLWSSLRSPRPEPTSLAAASTVLAQGNELAQKTGEVVLAPLSQEMNNLNRDFQNAVDFLVASVP
jgi:hypothetical protein